jgi:tRNA-uridine 2-sulfurtransferase
MRKAARKKGRVLMALSGGVDSAVSLYLLQKAGYQVEAVFMKNWSDIKGLKVSACPWLEDRREALRVAAFLGVPLYTLDFEKQYEKQVLSYFFNEYKAGRTPNPDVMCNKEIKFKLLYNWARKHGYDYLATGHYAQIKKVNSEYQLFRSVDEFKDQTYFIYNIGSEQLPRLLFPVGGLQKVQVKKLAKQIGLPNASRKESMGLCFVGRIRLKDFLQQKVKSKPGPIVLPNGKRVGTHHGLPFFTLGQREGIQVGAGGPYYVVRKDLSKNTLVVTDNPADPFLHTKEVHIHSMHWLDKPKQFPAVVQARSRHQGVLVAACVTPKGKYYVISFTKPQKAVASGQSIVLYNGKQVMGGGIIV